MSFLQAAAAGASTESIRRRCGEPVNTESSSTCNSSLPNKIQEKKKLLVLDLDETLVHRKMSTDGLFDKTCDYAFTRGKHTCNVKLRPYVHQFLERVSELFHVVIFTASNRLYADPALDFLDPQGMLIAGRYYYDSLVYGVDGYVKDLTIFGVDLAKVILVDNIPETSLLQKDNGIPIESWYSDPHDEELSTLLPFLERLAAADDVRPIIAERFRSCNK
ncbi:hypothetical protein MKX01_005031 [Papaver californicum]|nr:hypothetical protein MKX01_005031 [Papaver californicum]